MAANRPVDLVETVVRQRVRVRSGAMRHGQVECFSSGRDARSCGRYQTFHDV
jgi:hypothetical protein